jgi:GntR family transcriptional regulator
MQNAPVTPLYSQVVEYVTRAVESGEFTPGDRIASQRELCERFGISLMTARRAINELISEGIIYPIPGKGLFVANKKQPAEAGPLVSFSEDMASRGMRATSRVLESNLINANPYMARILQVELDQELAFLRRLRLADDRPMAIQSNYIVHQLCPGILQRNFEVQGLFTILRNEYLLNLADTDTTVEAVLAGEEEAELLQVASPASLLVTEQVTLLESGRPVEFARTVYRGDRYHLRFPSRAKY